MNSLRPSLLHHHLQMLRQLLIRPASFLAQADELVFQQVHCFLWIFSNLFGCELLFASEEDISAG